jgi:hypothetical protein
MLKHVGSIHWLELWRAAGSISARDELPDIENNSAQNPPNPVR